LLARITCLVCFISTVNSHSKKKEKEKKPITSSTGSGHITKLEQSIFCLSISMGPSYSNKQNVAIVYKIEQNLGGFIEHLNLA
jgi:hypothetical protein